MVFLKRPGSIILFVALSLGTMSFSAACAKPAQKPEPSATEVSASAGVSYIRVHNGERVEVRVEPSGQVTWTREIRDPATGASILQELRWNGNTLALIGALSRVMYELGHAPVGALGIRDGKDDFRALRISSGEAVAMLQPGARRATIFAALEQILLRPLDVQGPAPSGRLPFAEVGAAIATCHKADRASFGVRAVADTETRDYHKQVDDAAQARCVDPVLRRLEQALRNHGQRRPRDGLTERGGAIAVRRGAATNDLGGGGREREGARSDSVLAWPEVPAFEADRGSAPVTLYRVDAEPMAEPRARFAIFPAAERARGEAVALEFRTRMFERGVYAQPRRVWRVTVQSDTTARVAWQLWGSGDFAVIEVAFAIKPPPEQIASLFELARALRLNERKRWFCGETNIEVTTDQADDSDDARSRRPPPFEVLGMAAFRMPPKFDGPACPRIKGIAAAMQALLNQELISAPLEQATAPVIFGLRDCKASGSADAHAVLEYAAPGAPARLEVVPHHPGADLTCARATLSKFEPPSAVHTLWRGGKLRVVAKQRPWWTNEIKALAEEEPPAEAKPSAYRTRW